MSRTCRGSLYLYLYLSMTCLSCFLLPWSSPAFASPSPGLRGGFCNGSIAQCGAEEELSMDSEIHRRMLQGSGRYITPAALNLDRAICRPAGGNSYTNGGCLPQRSNRRTRPCNTYYRCRS